MDDRKRKDPPCSDPGSMPSLKTMRSDQREEFVANDFPPQPPPEALHSQHAEVHAFSHDYTTACTDTHKSLQSPFFIEICAGTARVTSFLQHLGLKSSFGVDHKLGRNSGRVLIADLTSKEGQSLCRTWLSSPNLAGVFIAPPCGTCSRARGIPVTLPNGLKIDGPQPLRSDALPNGLANLSWLNRQRVSSANKLYHFVTSIAIECLDRGFIVCIENPRSSLYWKTSFFKPLIGRLVFTAHQACAYGSSRPKWTVLAHNTVHLRSLNQSCPGVSSTHVHKPWGVNAKTACFSTSEETAYPPLLAYNIAYRLALELMDKGWKPSALELVSPDQVSYQFLQAVLGTQPKASRIPPLVSEFDHVMCITVPCDETPPVLPGEKLQVAWRDVPPHACLLKKPPLRSNWEVNTSCSDPNMVNLFFGVFRSPERFVKAAISAGHPVQKDVVLPHPLEDAVAFASQHSPFDIAKLRHETLSYWLGRAKHLSAEENKFHKSLPDGLREILSSKRLLLWKEMLQHYGYPDMSVFDEVTEGVSLVGDAPFVPMFDSSFKPAKMTVPELKASAPSARKSLFASVRSSGDADIDREVFQKTQDELECGWLTGPYNFCDLPSDAVVNRRFGIKQSSGDSFKVRLIDDFSASGVNSTVQVETSPKLHTLDVVGSLCLSLLRTCPSDSFVGKTVDLSAAYRQLGISPSSHWVSFIAVFDPVTRSPKIYAMRALPFGASKSVYSFLRVAHSMWWLGVKALKLLWSSFFDDFITLSKTSEAPVVSLVVEQFCWAGKFRVATRTSLSHMFSRP